MATRSKHIVGARPRTPPFPPEGCHWPWLSDTIQDHQPVSLQNCNRPFGCSDLPLKEAYSKLEKAVKRVQRGFGACCGGSKIVLADSFEKLDWVTGPFRFPDQIPQNESLPCSLARPASRGPISIQAPSQVLPIISGVGSVNLHCEVSKQLLSEFRNSGLVT